MKKGKKVLLIIGITFAALILMSLFGALKLWSQKTPVDYELHNENASEAKIAIITDNTEYKMGVKDSLVKKVDGKMLIEVFGLEDAKDVNAEQYDLVVVMAPMYAGRLQNDAKRFAAKNSESENLVLFISTGLGNTPDLGVDTIACATSDLDTAQAPSLSVEEAAQQIFEKLG